MPDHFLTAKKLCRNHPSETEARTVLDSVSLIVRRGERIAFVGANGSGKSTLLRLLSGYEKPDRGEVTYADQHIRNRIGYIPQDYRNALFPWLRLSANLFPGGDATPASLDQAKRLFPTLQLQPAWDKFPYQMSGGEQQLLLLARAILHRPAALFLDEPLSAVDITRRQLIHDFLGQWLLAGGVTVLLATHNLREAVLLSDRVHVLVTGKIIGSVVVPLAWPRHRGQQQSPEFQTALRDVLTLLSCSDE